MTKERAETIALDALAFLAGRPDDVERFLRNSGIEVDELRRRAGDPDMLRAVTEFVLSEDALVNEFCAAEGLDPRDIHVANHILGQP